MELPNIALCDLYRRLAVIFYQFVVLYSFAVAAGEMAKECLVPGSFAAPDLYDAGSYNAVVFHLMLHLRITIAMMASIITRPIIPLASPSL